MRIDLGSILYKKLMQTNWCPWNLYHEAHGHDVVYYKFYHHHWISI